MTKISVVIPCYNQAHWMRAAIDSALQQTHPDVEVIVVNDGSTDDTAAVARQYGDRIRYIEQENRGLSGARNAGIDAARGELIQFLDSDDMIDATKFERQLADAPAGDDLTLLISDYRAVNEDLTDHEWYLNPQLDEEDPCADMARRWETELSIPFQCAVFDGRFFREHRLRFDESLPNHEDWDFWMRVLALRPRITFTDEKLATYRIHGQSMCRNRAKMRAGFLAAIRKQRRLLREDRRMCAVLDEKMRQTKWSYQDVDPLRSRWPRLMVWCDRLERKVKRTIGRNGNRP